MQKNGIRYSDSFPVSIEDYLPALQTIQKGITAGRKHNYKVPGLTPHLGTVFSGIFHNCVSSAPSAKDGTVPKTRHVHAVHSILQINFAIQHSITGFPQPCR